MNALYLPYDIVDRIVDEFQSEVETLVRCSFVAHSFRVACHQRLFSDISLHSTRRTCNTHRYQHLLKLLAANPKLTHYIRGLHIIDDGEGDFDEETNGWITKLSTLPHFLKVLTRLQSFSLAFRNTHHIAWSSLPLSLRSTLLGLFHSNVLTTLSLRNLCLTEFPTASLVTLNRLKKLDIVSCSHLVHSSYPPLVPVVLLAHLSISHLESLEFGGSIPVRLVETLTHPQSSLKISRLRELSIRTGTQETIDAANAVLEVAANSIESFMWTLPMLGRVSSYTSDCHTPGSINLNSMPKLRHLLLGITFDKGDVNFSQLEWLTHVIEGYDSISSPLEEVTIILVSTHFGVYFGRPAIRKICSSLQKLGLDGIFSTSSGRYPGLRKVSVLVDPSHKVESDEHELKILLPKNLPLLASKGILVTGFCDIDNMCIRSSSV